jgi:ribosomal protein S18 acetylase RimI-like enzyme
MSRGKGTGAREAVDRLASRQQAMNLSLDPSMAPHYQHLAHHAVWDAMGKNKTTHDDLVRAMRGYAEGGVAHLAVGGPDWKPHPENDLLQPIGSSKMVGEEKLVADDGAFKSGLSMFPSSKKSYRYVYHDEDQTPIGAMQIATQGPRSKKAVIQNLYVAEANRRQGIASKLLDRARKDFDVKHSDDLTTSGKAFAKAKKAQGGRVTHAHHLDIEERPL